MMIIIYKELLIFNFGIHHKKILKVTKRPKFTITLKNLDGKLLLIHGRVNPTVVPQHSMTLLHEAVKQKVQINFFYVSNAPSQCSWS